MRTTVFWQRVTALLLAAGLAGCVSAPAPVVDHSFGPGAASTPPATAPQPGTRGAGSGVQTFGLGNHAQGTVTAAGYTVAPGDTLYSIAFAHGMDVRELAARNDISSLYVIHPGQVLKLATGAPVATPAASAQTPVSPTAPVFGPVTTQTMTPAGVAAASSVAAGPAASSAPVATPSPEAATTTTPGVTPVPGASRSVAGVAWQWPAAGKVVGGFQAGSGGDGAGLDIAGEAGTPVRAAAAGTVVYSGNGLIGYGELIIIKHNDTYLSAYGHNSKRLVKEGQRVAAGQEIALMGASGAPRVELHFEIRKNGKPVDPLDYLPKR